MTKLLLTLIHDESVDDELELHEYDKEETHAERLPVFLQMIIDESEFYTIHTPYFNKLIELVIEPPSLNFYPNYEDALPEFEGKTKHQYLGYNQISGAFVEIHSEWTGETYRYDVMEATPIEL